MRAGHTAGDTPYATESSLAAMPPDVAELEQRYMGLCMERTAVRHHLAASHSTG